MALSGVWTRELTNESDVSMRVVDRLRDHENEGVTASDRYALREEAAAILREDYGV